MTQPRQSERVLSYVAQRRCDEGKQKAVLNRPAARQWLRTKARIWMQRLKAFRRVCAAMINHLNRCCERAISQFISKPNETIF